MSRTAIIAGSIVVAWLIYITASGHLPGYLYVLGIGGQKPAGC
jgi:hypothetical protein